jgi:hypothetical protein
MKYSIICIFLLLSFTCKAIDKDDSIKLLKGRMSLLIEVQRGMFINVKSTNISVVPITNKGGEFTIKKRNKKSNLSFNIGVNYRLGMSDSALFRQSINEYFSRNYANVAVYMQTRDDNFNYGSFSISPSLSKIVKFKKIIIEPFLKMNFTFFDLRNDAIIYCTDINTNQQVNKELYFQQQKLQLIPAIGSWAKIRFSKNVYFTTKIEIGHNLSNQIINVNTQGSTTINELETIQLYFPKSYIIGSLGLHIIPFNRISKKEYSKWSPAKMKRFDYY